jgi:uncharacterized protein involved in cysteine biosynthesis
MDQIVRGARLLRLHPQLRAYLWKPTFFSLLIFVAVLAAGFPLFRWLATGLLTRAGLPEAWTGTAVAVLYAVLWFFLAGVVFLAIVSALGSFLWDGLSLKVERAVYGDAPETSLPRSVLVRDTLKRLVLNLGVAAAAFCCAWIVPVAGPIFLAGAVALLEFTAPAYQRRDVLLAEQRRLAFRLPGWPGFVAASGVLTLVPFVNALFAPTLVAGGTLLVAEAERGRPQ